MAYTEDRAVMMEDLKEPAVMPWVQSGEKVRGFVQRIGNRVNELLKAREDHESRIRELEGQMNILTDWIQRMGEDT